MNREPCTLTIITEVCIEIMLMAEALIVTTIISVIIT